MSLYKYESVDQFGNKKIGAVVAKNQREAYEILLQRNMQPIELERQYFISRKISTEDILLFFLHVSFQLKCGVHINEAIDTFIDFHGDAVLNATLIKVSEDLKNGEKISDAFKKNCPFNSIILGLLKAAEETGCLMETISSILNLLQLQNNWTRHIRRIVAYPTFITLLAITILFVSSHFLGPQVISLVQNYGKNEIPFLTKFAVDILPIVSTFLGIILLIIVGMIIIIRFNKNGQNIILQLVFKIPILSGIFTQVILWQLFEILHISCVAKLNFMSAFNLALPEVFIKEIKNQLINVKSKIMSGYKISTSFSTMPTITTDIVMAIFVGEEGNNLGKTFAHISEKIYSKLVNNIKLLGDVISIGLTLFTGMIFVFILCSMFAPIYDYIGSAGG